jgi:23S rRNA pseudouridine955/2504/2580 synthase
MKFDCITIPESEANSRLDHFLKRHYPHWPYGLIAKWCRQKKIKLNNQKTAPGDRLTPHAQLTLPVETIDEKRTASTPSLKTLSSAEKTFFESLILDQTEKLLVINKPPGLATQGGTGLSTSVDWLAQAYFKEKENRSIYLVHRLDRSTSGLLLVSKDLALTKDLTQAFKEQQVKKTYLALVEGHVFQQSGSIDCPLLIQGRVNDKVCISPDGKPSLTHFERIAFQGPNTLVRLIPQTGRMHQLRVHMASIGHPIIGDDRYAKAREHFKNNPDLEKKLYLHAAQIEFCLNNQINQIYTAPLPWQDMCET